MTGKSLLVLWFLPAQNKSAFLQAENGPKPTS